jgi:hypothetical protein
MKKLVIFLFAILLIACEKESMDIEALGENEGIIGTWIENGYEEDLTLLKRADILDPSKYGFTIADNGTFAERKNAGGCGTPPITYENYEGSWVALSDSLIEITVGYWGGTMTYQMRIAFLDAEDLQIRYLYTEDRLEGK